MDQDEEEEKDDLVEELKPRDAAPDVSADLSRDEQKEMEFANDLKSSSTTMKVGDSMASLEEALKREIELKEKEK